MYVKLNIIFNGDKHEYHYLFIYIKWLRWGQAYIDYYHYKIMHFYTFLYFFYLLYLSALKQQNFYMIQELCSLCLINIKI